MRLADERYIIVEELHGDDLRGGWKMYRGTALRCPSCTGQLEYARATLLAHRCPSCGGTWLGPEAAVHLLNARGGLTEQELVAAARQDHDGARLVVPDSEARRCPSCDLEMSPMTIGKTRIDSCPAHGTWFDRDEVELVVGTIAAMKRAGVTDPNDVRITSIVKGTETIVVGSLSVGFSFIADFLWWIYMAPRGHRLTCVCEACERPRLGR